MWQKNKQANNLGEDKTPQPRPQGYIVMVKLMLKFRTKIKE